MIFHISQGVLEKVEIEPEDDDVQVVLPSGIKEIGPGVFAYSGVRNVVFPESLEKIGRKAFTNTKLQTVKIPDKVMQIDYGAFSYCSNLRSIEIGKGLKEIGCKVFFGCGSLKNVYISEFTEHIDQMAFLGTPETVFYVKNGSCAYNFALKNNFRVQTGSDSDLEDQINKDLLSRYLKHNYICAPVSPDKEYPITLWETLPVHFYCLVEQEAVFHIHSKGLYIPSLLLKHESDESWTDGYVFTENRITAPKDDLVRIKISLRHNPDYINDTTGKKQVRVMSLGDSFLFLDAVHINPDQCYFLDPYVCTESDLKYGCLQLSQSNSWNNICHLIIPEGFTQVNDCACSGAQNLESVYIGDTVTYIGNDSFCNCPKLSSAYIGASVEASHTRAFINCPELRSVSMSANLKQEIISKRSMCRQSDWSWFIDCPQLKKIRFDDGTSIAI